MVYNSLHIHKIMKVFHVYFILSCLMIFHHIVYSKEVMLEAFSFKWVVINSPGKKVY